MITRYFCILLIMLCWSVSFAQPSLTLPNYRQYTLRDGLSQMQVISLFQDSRGYIWVGTKAGLNCYNGEKFVSYTTKKFPEIENDHIKQICEDNQGRIWAVTISGILRFDGNKLDYFRVDDNLNISIAADKDGRIWFSKLHQSGFKVSIHYIERDSIKTLPVDFPESKTIPFVELKYGNEEDVLLLSIGNLLYQIKNGKPQVIHRNNSFIHFFPGTSKVFFGESEDYNIDSEDIYNYNIMNYQNGKVRELARIRNGEIVWNDGLCDTLPYVCVSLPHSNFIITPSEIKYNAFDSLYMSCVISDKDGKFWVGAEDGLYQLFGNAFTGFKQELLPQIWAVTEDKKGSIWFSSYLYGLYEYSNNKIEHYPASYTNKVADFYFHPSMDKRGRLFFPNAFGILMVEGNRFKQKNERLYLTSFYEKEKDIIWGGREKGAEAYNEKWKKVRTVDEKSGLDVGKNVLTIGKDTSGWYWFGGSAGLARYNWQTDSLKNYKPGNQNTGVYTQRNDYKGRTWFGTKNGLFWYDAKNDSLCKVECEELTDAVNMLEPVDSTWLIVSQPYGIYLFDLQHYYKNGKIIIHLFNENNGFLGIEPGQDGAFSDSKGNVWMTTSTEVIKLDPRKLAVETYLQSVRVDKCNGIKLPFSSSDVHLPRNQNSAIITFETVCFNRPNPVQYSWKLEHDANWSGWQDEDYAVLSGLKDGLTRLQVRARIKGLPVSDQAQAAIGINVQIALYRQPWFSPALFFLISIIGIVLLGFTILQMRKASRDAKAFQVKAIQSQMNPHFIFNVLASLQSMILKANVSAANDYLVKLAELIRGFLESSAGTSTLKSPKDEQGLVTIESEINLLHAYVEFQQMINPGKFDFALSIDKNLSPKKELIPPLLLQPFVENAIRHGLLPLDTKGNLSLKISNPGKTLLIEITDNGIGIRKSEKLLKKSAMRYNSRGKELTLNRIQLLNQLGFKIECHTESNDEGTRVIIRIQK